MAVQILCNIKNCKVIFKQKNADFNMDVKNVKIGLDGRWINMYCNVLEAKPPF